jgi:hypothetical protein
MIVLLLVEFGAETRLSEGQASAKPAARLIVDAGWERKRSSRVNHARRYVVSDQTRR